MLDQSFKLGCVNQTKEKPSNVVKHWSGYLKINILRTLCFNQWQTHTAYPYVYLASAAGVAINIFAIVPNCLKRTLKLSWKCKIKPHLHSTYIIFSTITP